VNGNSSERFNKCAVLERDKSDNSRRTCPLIAFRYVHRGGTTGFSYRYDSSFCRIWNL